MNATENLLMANMQNLHGLMKLVLKSSFRAKKTPPEAVFCFGYLLDQDMNTAMNASKKIRTPPATGKTMGINGTMDSTTSAGSLCAGVG